MKRITIHTDGSCSNGVGGWAAILQFQDQIKEIFGYELDTTNNKMELLAAIKALEALKEPCFVTMVTDSRYLEQAFSQNWLGKWQKNGWRTAAREPVKNQELWQRLLVLVSQHNVQWVWQESHVGQHLNERADRLANQARTNQIQLGN